MTELAIRLRFLDCRHEVYRTELDITSRIFAYLDAEAFRNIALG